MDGQEKSRAEEFLELYRQLEDALEKRYRNKKRSSSSVVMEFCREEESAPVREKLDLCREIRNLLTHNAAVKGEPVVEPSAPMLEALREALSYVRRPPLALDFAVRGKNIMTARLSQRVLPLMEQMWENGYSHIPVMREGGFCGVFSTGAVFRYQLDTGGKAIGRETVLRELGKYLVPGEHMENYVFLPKKATYISARKVFEKPGGKNCRVSAIFITETGNPGERLLGMLTPWDVLSRF